MKVLVVGLGGIGQRHVRNLRRILGDGVEILACRARRRPDVLTDRLEVAGGDLEARYAINVCPDLGAALDRRPDVALVCNPSSLHLSTATAAAEAGCHLFIEKPLSASWEGVPELVSLVERKGLVALIGYQLRSHPGLRRLREHLHQGTLGRLITARAEVGEYLPDWHRYEDYREMYAARRDLGGGVILSQIHEMDYLYWLFGRPRRAFAVGGHLSSLDVDVEDTASVLMDFEVHHSALPVHLHQDYVQRPPVRTCDIVGEAGRARLDFRANTLDVTGTDGQALDTYAARDFDRNELFLDEMRHLLACVRGEQTPAVGLRDAMVSLEMALAVHRSLDTGGAVRL